MTASIADDPLFARARAWIEADPDPATRAELGALLEARDLAELKERFSAPLEFGTAGLRGVVGAGPSRMNRAVVIQTTRALADWLLGRVLDARSLPVVLGWDGRLSSRELAADAAGVLVAAGLTVRYFAEPVPTPLVAFAARELAAVAAIAITASHNPPEYNGYKVYGPNAVQIVPPLDAEIAERVTKLGPAASIPRVDGVLEGQHALCQPLPSTIEDRYLAAHDAERLRATNPEELSIVYTPLHGVGWRIAERAFRLAGYANVAVVPEQAAPDGRFPTVRFPNPEEPGALDLALEQAQRSQADLVLANDPDADRLAACAQTATGRYVQLSGNQLGLLLADHVLERVARTPQPLVIASLVSSPMIADVARAHGARFVSTLTGFKWIWTAALSLEAAGGVRFAFGYEEALGYSVARLVRDKDGISAAVAFSDLAARAKAEGATVLDRLDRLYRRHGLWVSVQKSVVRAGSQGLADIARATERAALDPAALLAGRRVSTVVDYRSGFERRPVWLGKANLVELGLEGGGRVLVRPSGTEPKLKIYVDLRVEVSPQEGVRERESSALAEARALADAVAQGLLPA